MFKKQMKFLIFITSAMLAGQGCSHVSAYNNKACYTINDCASEVQRKISSNWLNPNVGKKLSAEILITLNESEELKKLKLIKSSGSKEFDRSIIKAVQDSSPFSMINYLDENDRKEFDEILFKFMPEY